jgi:GT2 family glycosyltransferase
MVRGRQISASVIIPSHNRSALLRRVLDALCVQEFPPGQFEVIVVADGCRDDTMTMLSSYGAPFSLVSLTAEGVGPAQARNIGAAQAAGPLLVFLDDDVVPERQFLRAHSNAHSLNPGSAVIGPYPPYPNPSSCLFRLRVRAWWTEHFAQLARSGHRFSYRDLLTGNLSLSAELWKTIGGLDPCFRHAREDYELGIRLLQRKVPFVFVPEALGYHHEHLTTTLTGSFRRSFEEGRSDVRLGRKHPYIRAGLRVTLLRLRSRRRQRLIDNALFLTRGWVDPVVDLISKSLSVLQRRGLRAAHLGLYSALNRYWYLRGALVELKTLRAWKDFAAPLSPLDEPSELVLNLKCGVEAAAAALDRLQPRTASISYGKHLVCTLPEEPGSEPWKGRHLRASLVGSRCGLNLLRAMAVERQILSDDQTSLATVAGIVRSIEASRHYYGSPRPSDMWLEQYAQWSRFNSLSLSHPSKT